jgi:hypothetical protein
MMMMKRSRGHRAVLFLLLMAGCAIACACAGPNLQRVAADRATYDWFAPMTRGYIQADPRLDDAAKATHLRSLDAWNDRIKADEAAAGAVVPIAPPPAPPSAAAPAAGGAK